VDISKSENSIYIDYRDNGVGIHDSISKNIFNPFVKFSNHEDSLGLGMTIVQKTMDIHEGFIEVIPSEAGAYFRITLFD